MIELIIGIIIGILLGIFGRALAASASHADARLAEMMQRKKGGNAQ